MKLIVIGSIIMLCSLPALAQVKIGGNATPPPASAVLEIDGGSNKGLLLPRMRKQDIDAIQNPAEGLTIYATDEQAVYLRKSLVWEKQVSFKLPGEYLVDTSSRALYIENTGSGDAIWGTASGGGAGIVGYTKSDLGFGVRGISTHQGSTGGQFYNSLGGAALITSFGRVGLGGYDPSAIVTIDGSHHLGTTLVINDLEDPIIQIRKDGINKSYIKQEGNNLVLRPNGQNSSGKVVLQSYNDGGWMFLDAAGDVSVGINPVGFNGTPLGSRLNIRSESGATLTLDAPYVNSDGPSLNLVSKSANLVYELGSLKATPLSMKLKTMGKMNFEAEAMNNVQLFDWSNTYLGVGTQMGLSSNGYLNGVLNVTGSIGIGVYVPTSTLHVKATSGYSELVTFDAIDPIVRIKNGGIDKGFVQLAGNDIKIGTYATNDLGNFVIRTNGSDRIIVRPDGKMVLGSPTGSAPVSNHLLAVKGRIAATEFTVTALASWPDYVFAPGYQLNSLEETERFIKANSHLPGIPAAAIVEKDGYDIGDMQKRMMEKIEELTLHLINANKAIQQQSKEIGQLQQQLQSLLKSK